MQVNNLCLKTKCLEDTLLQQKSNHSHNFFTSQVICFFSGWLGLSSLEFIHSWVTKPYQNKVLHKEVNVWMHIDGKIDIHTRRLFCLFGYFVKSLFIFTFYWSEEIVILGEEYFLPFFSLKIRVWWGVDSSRSFKKYNFTKTF